MTLKIGRIPPTTPVKLAVACPPAVYESLVAYARFHKEAHTSAVTPAELLVLMAEHFMAADTGFRRMRDAGRRTNAAKEQSP